MRMDNCSCGTAVQPRSQWLLMPSNHEGSFVAPKIALHQCVLPVPRQILPSSLQLPHIRAMRPAVTKQRQAASRPGCQLLHPGYAPVGVREAPERAVHVVSGLCSISTPRATPDGPWRVSRPHLVSAASTRPSRAAWPSAVDISRVDRRRRGFSRVDRRRRGSRALVRACLLLTGAAAGAHCPLQQAPATRGQRAAGDHDWPTSARALCRPARGAAPAVHKQLLGPIL